MKYLFLIKGENGDAFVKWQRGKQLWRQAKQFSQEAIFQHNAKVGLLDVRYAVEVEMKDFLGLFCFPILN